MDFPLSRKKIIAAWSLFVALFWPQKIKHVRKIHVIYTFIEKTKIAAWSLIFCGKILVPKHRKLSEKSMEFTLLLYRYIDT